MAAVVVDLNDVILVSSSSSTAITPPLLTFEADAKCEALPEEVAIAPVLEVMLTSLKSSIAEREATELVIPVKDEETAELNNTVLDATCKVNEPPSARVWEAEYDSWTSEIDTADVSLPESGSVATMTTVVRI